MTTGMTTGMTSGMATVAGSVMIAYVTMLQNQFPETNLIQHMITASVLSIPAAIMYSNIIKSIISPSPLHILLVR